MFTDNWVVDVLVPSGVLSSSSGVDLSSCVLSSSDDLGLSCCVLGLATLDVLGLSCCVYSLVESSFKRLFRVMDNLSLNWDVLILLDLPFPGDILNGFLRDILRNVLSQILNGVIVSLGDLSWNALDPLLFSVFSHFSCLWHSLDSHFISIFYDLFLEWHILDPALTFDHFCSSVHGCVNDLRCLHLGGTGTHITLVVSIGGSGRGVSSLLDISSCVRIPILIGRTVNLLVSIKVGLATILSIKDTLTTNKFSYKPVNKSALGHMICML